MADHITQTPDGLRFVRAKGGTKTHLLPQGTMKALCGHEPSSPGSWRMKARSGWWLVRMDIAGDPAWCEKCQQARPTKGEVAAEAEKLTDRIVSYMRVEAGGGYVFARNVAKGLGVSIGSATQGLALLVARGVIQRRPGIRPSVYILQPTKGEGVADD